jgi:superfamily II RNA helicase
MLRLPHVSLKTISTLGKNFAVLSLSFKCNVLKIINYNLLGVFTKDYRYDVESCQILVTVPECLDVMIFSPQYANLLKRIRWVIFDEVWLSF